MKRCVFDGDEFVLTFEDTFERDGLDLNKWEYLPELKREDTGVERKRSMISVHDGKLFCGVGFQPLEEGETHEAGTYPYGGKLLTGGIRCHPAYDQTYGLFEARCKVLRVSGCWDAFWMVAGSMTESEDHMGYGGAEIDIMESTLGDRYFVGHTVHWDGYGENLKSAGGHYHGRKELYEGFHTYTLKWTKSAYTFYIDGKKSWETDICGTSRNPGFMKITTEFGPWGGEVTPDRYPDSMEVDYVRVWQFADLLKESE